MNESCSSNIRTVGILGAILLSVLISSKNAFCEQKSNVEAGQVKRPHPIYFAGQRNRSNFELLKDSNLSKLFAPDFVWDIRVFKDQAEFLKMTAMLRQANPNIILGSYASAVFALAEEKDYFPPAEMPLSQCPKSWLLRDNRNAFVLTGDHNDHYFMDVRQSAVREAVISLAIARAKHNGLDAVCFDNCYWGLMPRVDFPVSAAEWTSAYMEFYREAGNEVHKAGLKCVVNVATYPGSIPAAFAEIAPFVDGIMTEMAFYKSVRTPEGLYKELKGYENVLKQGKMVLLIPFNKEDEQFALLAIRPLAKKYGRIYLAAAGLTHYEPLYFLADSEWDIAAD